MSGICDLKFPRHNASLTLYHNDHKDGYESVEHYVRDLCFDWVSDDQRSKALATNEMWRITWYPDNSCAAKDRKSFFAVRVFACTSEELDAIEQKYRDAGAIGHAPRVEFPS